MNETQFLQGPWEITSEEWPDCGGYQAPQIFSIADPSNPKVVCTLAVRAEWEENANLIAAAPKLYDGCNALLGLIDIVSHNPDVPQFVKDILNSSHRKQEAEAAVAKAVQP